MEKPKVIFPAEERYSPSELKKLGVRLRRSETGQRIFTLEEVETLLQSPEYVMRQQSKEKRQPLIRSCDTCNLKAGKIVNLSGNLGIAKVLFVGEAPGAKEEEQGIPFVGPAGQLLRRVIKESGIDEADCAFTNVLKCRPPQNRVPASNEIDCCRSRLESEIFSFGGLIVCLGGTALQALLGRRGIRDNRGYGFYEGGKKYFVTYHPSAALRAENKEIEELLLSDLKKVASFTYKKNKISYDVIATWEDLSMFVDHVLTTGGWLSCDLETNTLDASSPDARILSIAFSDGEKHNWFIPLECKDSMFGEKSDLIVKELERIFTAENVKLIMQEAIFDVRFLKEKYGAEVLNLFMDTKIAHFVLEGKHTVHALKSMAWRYTDFGGYDVDREKMVELSFEQLAEYNCWDAFVTFKLAEIFNSQLSERQRDLVTRIIPLAQLAVAEMEADGMKVDKERLTKFVDEYSFQLSDIEEKLHSYDEIAIYEQNHCRAVNFGSPKQVVELLGVMGVVPSKRTKSGNSASVDNEALEEIKGKSPFVATLLQHRKVEKILNTYLMPYKASLDRGDQVIRGDYSFTSTATGRLSCREPNFQNVPDNARSAFIPKRDVFVEVDFGQIELRVLAMYSKDPKLIDAFNSNEDIHARVGKEIFGKAKLTREERVDVKGVNFGTVYGITAFGLSKTLGCSEEKAQGIIDRFYAKFDKVPKFQNSVKEFAEKHHYYETFFGRRRWFSFRPNMNQGDKNSLYRQAVNFPIQSTASDLVIDALGRCWREMRRRRIESCLVAEVHDSVLFDVVEEELEAVLYIIKTTMESFSYPWINVPLKLSVKLGPNWKDLQEIIF